MKMKKGFTLVELLVVIALFSVIAVLTTQSLFLSLRGSNKSNNVQTVKRDLEFAMARMERSIRNAEAITVCDPRSLTFIDSSGASNEFSCNPSTNVLSHIIDGIGAPITSTDTIVGCDSSTVIFSCSTPIGAEPPSVMITLYGESTQFAGTTESGIVDLSTLVLLRTY